MSSAQGSKSEATVGEGFDLDALADADGEVIYELGGGVTSTPTEPLPTKTTATAATIAGNAIETKSDGEPSPTEKSEELKAKGNENFKNGNYLDAIDYYTDAIEACPGMSGADILQSKATHEEEEREKSTQRYNRDTDRRMDRHKKDANASATGEDEPNSDANDKEDEDLAPKKFVPPSHPYGKNLSVYYNNRAACLTHLQKYKDAIEDCDIAILVNPSYTKAYVRRMTCFEQSEQIEDALQDAKKALELSPTNRDIQKHVNRLQKLEDERMEKLKEETMGKLKDLGNSILGNFGMSLDNFKTQQDPNTGSYNISFGNNK
mmetsp:Transcript_6718/g.9640  ORF Transcript_6718/g.9640 Transcript_6718/m.9640 type:complete len:320 (-) Transcript_6718:70-1029(-)